MTGWRVPRARREPQRRTREIARIQREFILTEPVPIDQTVPIRATFTGTRSPALSDDDVLSIARMAKNGAKFVALWDGDVCDYGSQSEADMALAGMLVFYTQDAGQLQRLFMRSALYRPTGKSRTYLATTIRKVIERGGETWQPSNGVRAPWSACRTPWSKPRSAWRRGRWTNLWSLNLQPQTL